MRLPTTITILLALMETASAQPAPTSEPPREPPPAPAATPAAPTAPAAAAPNPGPAPADAPPPLPSEPTRKSLTALPRETMIENALGARPITGSAFGGYGEITLNAPGNADAVIDFRRFVLFFGHDFNDRIRFYSEVEVEHAVASSTDVGGGGDRAGLPRRSVRQALQPARRPRHHADGDRERLSRAAELQRRRSAGCRPVRDPEYVARARRGHLRRALRRAALPAVSRQRLQRERVHGRVCAPRRSPGSAVCSRGPISV